jgi:Acetyltransferase (GNAT) domain
MKTVMAAIEKGLLKQELNAQTFLRFTNKGDNEIYIVNQRNSPNVLKEIGRLRELAFRESGGGTGQELDLDIHDTGEYCYQQLIVWDPEADEIIGGYRFVDCSKAFDAEGNLHLSTLHYFNFSEAYIHNYIPHMIELGRSFIQPKYQSKDGNRKGLFSLDNLWDGLGALMVCHKNLKYFSGKVTMYPSFNQEARDCILAFMHHYFPDKGKLVTAKAGMRKDLVHDVSAFKNSLEPLQYKEGHLQLVHRVKELGESVPPLINSYMNLSATMKTFETAMNKDFGGVEETGILIDIRDIYDTKKDRHVVTFDEAKSGYKA